MERDDAPPPSRPRRHRRRGSRRRLQLHDRRVLAGRPDERRPVARPIRRAADRLPAGDVGLRRARCRPRGRPAGRPVLTAIVASSGETARPAAGRRADVDELGLPRHGRRSAAAGTIVADSDISSTGGGSTATIEGAWAPPTIGDDPTPTGLSADGKTLVLVPAGDPDPARTTSRFAIVPFPPIEGAPELAQRVVELPGALDFDAISPDGRILYVAQHLDGRGRLPGPRGRPAGRHDAAGHHRRQAQPRRGDGRLAARPAALAERHRV